MTSGRKLYWKVKIQSGIVRGQPEVLELAFPPAWDGDQFQKVQCPSQGIPQWLDGYFLIQTAGSFGKQSDQYGQKMVHLFDGIGAVTSIELSGGQATFSARYYPSRTYKIWDFYNRDLSQSKVAWIPFGSPYNKSAKAMWNHIPLYDDDGIFQTHPNIDFWRIGKNVVGATEHVGIGMQFNVPTLTNFTHPSVIETHDFFKYNSSIVPLIMPVHERKNQDDIIYGACEGFDPFTHKMYQIVFKVTPDGTRTVEGMFEMGTYDPAKCTPNGTYTGDKRVLANYMHSITSTEHYVILPLTSIIFNPCKLSPLGDNLTSTLTPNLPKDVMERLPVVEYASDIPMKFLVFDKKTKKFVTEKPIEADVAMTPVHQFNAYEDSDGTLVADMGAVDGINGDAYSILTIGKILHGVGKAFLLQRFRINVQTKSVNRTNVISGHDYVDGEFPNFNQKFIERKYKYGYMMTNFLKLGAKITKIDMDQHKIIAEFSAPGSKANTTVFREPWFVPRPNSTEEDDGVVLALGGDVQSRFSTLYIIEAKNMTLLGHAQLPTFVPLGLHNRFFFKSELGLNGDSETDEIFLTNMMMDAIESPRSDTNGTWNIDSKGNSTDQSENILCNLFKDFLDKTGVNLCNEGNSITKN